MAGRWLGGRSPIHRIVVALLVVALAASAYAWIECREENRRLVESIYYPLDSVLVLSGMADFLEYSIGHGAANACLRLQLIRFRDHAGFLSKVFSGLYGLTHEKKYDLLYTATETLYDFLIDVSNDEPARMRARVKDSLGTLKSLQELFKELSEYRRPEEIPESLARELFTASQELSYK
ncbi:MAG: hypothetical protein ABWW69_06180 [Pyrodictiaceae archaeon]